MKTIIDQIKNNIKGYNKYMTDVKLEKMSIVELLANTNPLDRQDFITQLKK